jgi:YggT family protein
VEPIGVVIELVLWFYILFLLARLVADYVQMFARSWEPRGFIMVMLEFLYSVTDPPIKLLRRLIPPIRLGGMALDLSILIVLLICYVLWAVNRSTLLAA